MKTLTMVLWMLLFSHLAAAAEEEKFVKGSFTVPVNRRIQGSRTITLNYVRLPATGSTSGPPIVYLAGGPGGSGIAAMNYRARLFTAMRAYGDVIALDQRGTGASNDLPKCESKQVVPTTTSLSDQKFIEYNKAALRECLTFWKQSHVDLRAYNTVESAHDLEDLRKHLGADKLVLWGTSYGSHLALAALKEIEGSIDKVVISSVEGLDQTIKLPAGTEHYLARLQEAVDSQPSAKAAYPDIRALMSRVHAKLDRKPLLVKLKSRDGSKFDYLLHRRDMQLLAAGLIADPKSAALLLNIYLAIDRGVEPPFENILLRWMPDHLVEAGKPISFEPMPVAMDMASGMSSERRSKVARQAKTAIFGSYLDFVYHFDGMAPELDLGDAYRENPRSNVPVLVLSGSLDGRTVMESQREAVSGLRNVRIISVQNAGHNLYDEPSKEIPDAIGRFMQGKLANDPTIVVDLTDMAPKQP